MKYKRMLTVKKKKNVTCATAEATRKHVASTPTTGVTGSTAWTALGKNLFVIIPTTMGASTTYIQQTANRRSLRTEIFMRPITSRLDRA